MEAVLNLARDLINKSENIPENIKPIVRSICLGYIRESDGEISIEDVIRVCETKFFPREEKLEQYDNAYKPFGLTNTRYDKDGKVYHEMEYIYGFDNVIKLISNLTHEIGHIITERNANAVVNRGDGFSFDIVKKTADIYLNVRYQDDELICDDFIGYRMTDGFLESISTKIFSSPEFRSELRESGFDLEDYVYKDERLFPSRVYDEYKACFELFDFLTDGAIYKFAVRRIRSDKDIVDFMFKHNLIKIYKETDKVNDTIWKLKPYEDKPADKTFNENLYAYTELKKDVIKLANELKKEKEANSNFDYEEFERLLNNYKNTIYKQKHLPIPEDYKFLDDDRDFD